LASIHNLNENRFLVSHLSTGAYQEMWIGLKREDGTLQWTDGSQVNIRLMLPSGELSSKQFYSRGCNNFFLIDIPPGPCFYMNEFEGKKYT